MYIVALDIGGTKTIAAILNEKGEILAQEIFTTVLSGYEEQLELCAKAMKRLIGRIGMIAEDFEGLGVSLPGMVDNREGMLIYAPYAKWENVPVAEILKEKLSISNIFCENDVNACAIGELKFGLGKKYSDFVWITISTGVGGAIVSDFRLIRGAHGFAGELGHLKVEYEKLARCPCGQFGCLEAHGSGTALTRQTMLRVKESPVFAKALKKRGFKPDGAGCAALAKEGNKDAMEILNQMGTYLGRGISYCINVLDTQIVVIGGGVAASLNLLLPSIRASIRQNTFMRMQNIEIIETPLGYKAALLGAASLVLTQKRKN